MLYAGALLRARRIDDASKALEQSLACAYETKQCSYDAEHARLRAEVYRAGGRDDEAEAAYRRALEVSRRQGARWLELRASRGYADFLAAAARTDEARGLLDPLLASFTEGRDTYDYLAAEALARTL